MVNSIQLTLPTPGKDIVRPSCSKPFNPLTISPLVKQNL
jgi:hypothetical protein